MNFYKLIIFILVVFLKTDTLFSNNDLFNVNNIELEKRGDKSNKALSDKAIETGFNQLITKILLKEDISKFLDLSFIQIKQLVTYYQISNITDEKTNKEFVSFSITFDRDKMHELFYKKGVSYSKISDKELYVLPILIEENEIFIFNNNFFYDNWNKIYENDLIDFILPLENIEIIQNLNENKGNLIDLNIDDLFQEYLGKNLALIYFENNKTGNAKVYIKAKLQGKIISKNLKMREQNLKLSELYDKIITETKKELINMVKSKNLIDIRTPSFLNVTLKLSRKANLVELKERVKDIDLIENIFVQEFNKDFIKLRIKYLGKLEKIIERLKDQNINLKLNNDQWIITTL